jgi:radical SAM protein with 4Fe4S-binding SPASM domain
MAITFSGGEPLIFEHLFEIIERVNQRDNKLVNVVTNGWLLRKYADRLLDSNISSITVSIDSHRPEAHDRFRNKEGLFERAIEGIAYIRSKRKNKPKILLRATITRDNINEIDKFIDFFKDKVDHIAFQPVSNTKGHTTRNDNILFSEQDREYFSKLIYGYIDRHPFMNNLYYKSLAKYFLNHDLLIKDKAFRCLFWSNCVLIIEPWGDAYPCLRFTNTENAPNVRSQPIIDIWRSNRMRAMKETMCDTKEKCSCWGYNQYISLYLTRLNKFIPMRGCLY